jgi:putative glutamine amidotransferase
LEFAVFKHVFPTQKPVLAICRGMQFVNVALGGTLYQDIPSQLPSAMLHKQSEPKTEYAHEIQVLEDTPLYRLLGKNTMRVNSFHHQAVKRLGSGLVVMATAADGIIEAAYVPGDRYFRAYQWHPEGLVKTCADNEKIIQEFIDACKQSKR